LPREAAIVRPSLRFLALAVLGWALFRAAAMGILPGTELFRIERRQAKPPPIVATQIPAIEPVVQPILDNFALPAQDGYRHPPIPPLRVPIYYVAQVSPPAATGKTGARVRPSLFSSNGEIGEWPLPRPAALRSPSPPPAVNQQHVPAPPVPPIEG